MTTPFDRTRRTRALGVADLNDPLFRSGHSLMLSSLLTSVVGFGFWIVAARNYRPEVVGTDSVELSTMMFLSGVAQLNLAGALIRFLPTAGRRRGRFVLGSYVVSAAISAGLATLFLALADHLSDSFAFLHASRTMEVWWVLGTVVWGIFVLEDGALTGLRRATWVPIENTGFSFVKIVLVVLLATSFRRSGIFLAWTIATAATVIPLNALLFARAVPAEQARHPAGDLSVRQLRTYVPYDYLASLAWLAATSLLPLLIVRRVGPTANAFFSLSWLIAYFLYLVSINVGSSLIVEVSARPEQLVPQAKRVIGHLAKLLVIAVIVIEIAAPDILRVFGTSYAAGGAATLRLLSLSALPFLITSTAVSGLRARGNTKAVLCIDGAICCSVIGISWVLLPSIGIVGAGWAWLITQSVIATVLSVLAWPELAGHRTSVVGRVRLRAARVVLDLPFAATASEVRSRLSRYRADRFVDRIFPELVAQLGIGQLELCPSVRSCSVKPSVSDTTVALLDDGRGAPIGVVKIPRSEQARVDLCQGSASVTLLSEDRSLGEWRSLLPKSSVIGDTHPFVLEAHVPGRSAEELIDSHPELMKMVTQKALQAIEPMHRSTVKPVRLDEDGFENLAGKSLRTLGNAHPSSRVPDSHRVAVQQVSQRLEECCVGREVELSWVHGDFSPGNVILSEDGERVTGIVDWGQSKPLGIATLDVLSFVGALYCRQRHVELGHLVVEILGGTTWPEDEILDLAGAAFVSIPIDHCDLMLWSWLEHVAGNIAKSSRYAKSTLWWAANVEPVLQVVGA